MAGGYDERVKENVEHYQELKQLRQSLGLADHVSFLRSFTDRQKLALLKSCTCLLYTPDKEHFGIVPIEAMYMQKPVIAVASGGPLETITDGETGFLCKPEPEAFAAAMKKFGEDCGLAQGMGQKGRQRVEEMFSFAQFTQKLNSVVEGLVGEHKKKE
jgi:alpha-1,3/alpha-1,6-mannosyltransferase